MVQHRLNAARHQQETLPSFAPVTNRHRARVPLYAAIDLGTHNCRLLVARAGESGLRVIDSFSRAVRLGEGLHHSGKLAEAAMERTITALRACVARMGLYELHSHRAIATEACRRAANGMDFIARVMHETGLNISVISAREEAELALAACNSLLHGHGGTTGRDLLFDIGGGSTEIAWARIDRNARRHDLSGYVSLPVGIMTLGERYGSNIFTDAGYHTAVEEIGSVLRGFDDVHCITREIARGNVMLLGTSGTVTTLASLAQGQGRYERAGIDGSSLSIPQALDMIGNLRRGGMAGLVRNPVIGPDRARYLLPGCAIFEAIATTWPMANVTVADRGLRDGLLLRMIGDRRQHGGLAPLPFSLSLHHHMEHRVST
ncbi:Ppx/GppA phosphatase family protein [Komagataeibacter medellinensis]|uniref:Exopolyphosphatase n=1 Tax=Komagataeibacter medellinensis (strain NBRC 3288 / BCRC 11682 / LMG 1693 / Kondo 51) TaxID=634177 RepID=G2I4L8_KOMMN|nr:Ppx/GppA phosphatase family protein [Komagataeibacter medellinensis]BAK83065.1 exopolyphosphatase [Komagataeibacter medellinensis NBRC 3288]